MGALEDIQRQYAAEQMTHQPTALVQSPVDLGLLGRRNLSVQTLPGQDVAAAQRGLDTTANVVRGLYDLKTLPAYLFPPAAVPAAAVDLTEGYVRSDPVQAATSAFGLPGRAAKAGVGALSLAATPTEAQAAPNYSGIKGLYSRVADEVSKIQGKMPKASADNWLSWFNKNPNVPQAELKWGGLGEKLRGMGNRPITAEEISQYLADNPIPVSQKTLDDSGSGLPMYRGYSLPGESMGYDEKLFHWNPKGVVHRVIQAGDEEIPDRVLDTLPTREAAERLTERRFNDLGYDPGFRIEQDYDTVKKFTAPHFGGRVQAVSDADNLAFHTRTNRRQLPSGERAYHVEEIQSDWAQKGRDKGFYDPEKPYEVFDLKTGEVVKSYPTLEEARQSAHSMDDTGRLYDFEDASRTKVEMQPFAEEQGGIPLYAHTAFRKNLFDAAEADSDYLTWTTGQQQAERFPNEKNRAGMEMFYDNKMRKIAEREARRLGLDPKEVVTKVPVGGTRELDLADEYMLQDFYDQEMSRLRDMVGDYEDSADILASEFSKTPQTPEEYRQAFKKIEELTGGSYDWGDADFILNKLAPVNEEVWAMKLSPEVRKQIREKGLPFMGVAATAGASGTGD